MGADLTRILVVEDETALADAIKTLLIEQGFTVDHVGTVFAGIEAAMSDAYDCLIVDIKLSDGSGLELVRELRALQCLTPIMMLTVYNEAVDRVTGLNTGADDYMGKPFHAEELVARLNALVRRSTLHRDSDDICVGDITLNRRSRSIQKESKVLELSSKEFMLLEYMFRHPRQILSRAQLESHLWGPGMEISPNALDTYVYFLRKKCGKLGIHQLIRTVRGQGYTLDPALTRGE